MVGRATQVSAPRSDSRQKFSASSSVTAARNPRHAPPAIASDKKDCKIGYVVLGCNLDQHAVTISLAS